MSNAYKLDPDSKSVLAKAVLKAADHLGLSRTELEQILGRSRSGLTRDGLAPDSKAGELAMLLIRIYRALYSLVGGNNAELKHWFGGYNRHLQAVPRDLVLQIEGLVRTLGYLDAMRGKA